jgi:hypothetical protein
MDESFWTYPLKMEHKNKICIIKAIADNEKLLETNPEWVILLSSSGPGELDKIFTYNDILTTIDRQNEESIFDDENQKYNFKDIIGHQGSLAQSHEDSKGSLYKTMVEWEHGEVIFEPLDIFGCDDPVSCALYCLKMTLLINLASVQAFGKRQQ